VLKLAADENFNGDVLRGLLCRVPSLDLVRVQDAGLSGADDVTVLEWAAWEGRVLLTHDVTTHTAAALDRVRAERVHAGRHRGRPGRGD
jgi:predicted nuclease of predicted toxin-antitoxin system